MIKFNVPYIDRVSYPIEAGLLFQDVCNQVGLVPGNMNFTNSDYMILGNPFTNNETCRTVLSNIAQLAGGFVRIGRDNKPYIISLKKTIEDIVETIDGNNYFEDFAKNNEWGEVNCLVIRLSQVEGENTTVQDDESIEENGLTEIVIEDNYLLPNEVERENAIQPLWNTLRGVKYLPFKTEYYGYPYLDAGDMIYIKDNKDDTYISYVFNHIFTYNGAFTGSIETSALTKTQTEYKNTQNVKNKFRNVELKVDKINGEITSAIELVENQNQKVSEVEQTVEGIKSTVQNVETTINENTETINTMQTQMQQDSSSFSLQIENLSKSIDETNSQVEENELNQSRYLRYYLDANNDNKGTLELGESNSPLKVKLTNEEMAFTENDNKVAYINGNKLYITTAEILTALIIGNFGFTPLSNGSVTFGKVK